MAEKGGGALAERNDTGEKIGKASFAMVVSMSNDELTPDAERKKWRRERETRVDKFKKFEDGDFLGDMKRGVRTILRNNDWDDVYDQLTVYAETKDREFKARHEHDPILEGLPGIAVRAEAARVLVAGIKNRFREKDMRGKRERQRWLKEKDYTVDEVTRFERISDQNHILDLAPDAPEELVGNSIEKDNTLPERVAVPGEMTVVVEERGFVGQIQKEIKELKKTGETNASAWGAVILKGIFFAEKNSGNERKRSEENRAYWEAVEGAIQEIPDGVGRVDRNTDLAKFLNRDFPDGLRFKDRLRILFSARRHLNDRFVEVSRAGGALTKMGVGAGDVPFEGITYKVQEITPVDFEILYHIEELFPELAATIAEKNEMLPNLDRASCAWLDVGIRNSSIQHGLQTPEERDVIRKIVTSKGEIVSLLQRKRASGEINQIEYDEKIMAINRMDVNSHWVGFDFVGMLMEARILDRSEALVYASAPTFDNSLNNASTGSELRKRMATFVGSKTAEELSFRMLTCCLTFEMLDRNRTGVQGSSEARDLMWVDRKRLFELGEKEREPGLDWTVHRYFVSRPDPEAVIDEKEARRYQKLQRRRETLQISAERAVLVEKPDYFGGEILGDFFHNVMVFVPDGLNAGKSIRRNFASFVIDGDGSVNFGGFRKMPFLEMGPESYSSAGYWGYTLAKAGQLAAEISSTTYKEADELVEAGWWNKKRDLFARLEHVSPRLIVIEFKARGQEVRNLLSNAGGFNQSEIDKIAGYSYPGDLEVISDAKQRRRALGLITRSSREISKTAKENSGRIRNLVIDKMRMVHAIGTVWPGSIDAIKATEGVFGSSRISPGLLNRIIRAIEASRYLEGGYLDQFKLECEEMGFGNVWAGRRRRYRNPVNKDLWNS